MDQQMVTGCDTSNRSCTEADTDYAAPLQLQEGLVSNERLASSNSASAVADLDPLSLRGAVVLRYELPVSKRRRWHSMINTTLAGVLGAMVLWANVVRLLPNGQYDSVQQHPQPILVANGISQLRPVPVGFQRFVPVGIQQAVPAGCQGVPVIAQSIQTGNPASGNIQSAPPMNQSGGSIGSVGEVDQSRRQLGYSSGRVMAQPIAAQPMAAHPMVSHPSVAQLIVAQPITAQMATPCHSGLRGKNVQPVKIGQILD